MRMSDAVRMYLRDMRTEGRITSDPTERRYTHTLKLHAEDVSERDPRSTGREDVKRTIARWKNPNTQRVSHAILASFYDWAMEEGWRKDNPARQVRRARKRPTTVYRLTRQEVVRLLEVSHERPADQRLIHLAVCAGLRKAELRGLQGRHFRREGWVWVSADIAKGGKERWVPVLPDLQEVWREASLFCADREFVICGRKWKDPGTNTQLVDVRTRPLSEHALHDAVVRLGQAAGIAAPIHPHLLRHAFGDHIARHAGLHAAQALMGHADVSTTAETYVGSATLDELAAGVRHFTWGTPLTADPNQPEEATSGFEPESPAPPRQRKEQP